MGVLIAGSIVLQLVCVGIALMLWRRSRNGSWRFWFAMAVAFVFIVIRRSVWLGETALKLDPLVADGLSITATCVVSVAFLAAMVEAALFHHSMRTQIHAQSENIQALERRLGDGEHGA